jgi:hypothetical protein
MRRAWAKAMRRKDKRKAHFRLVVELTANTGFPSFFRQRPRRFAPDFRPGIFIVQRARLTEKIYG